MRSRRTGTLLFRAAVLVAFALVPSIVAAQDNFLPLSRGNWWLYSAKVRWTVTNSNVVRSARVRWKMEVTDAYRQGQIAVAILRRRPWDLGWYEPQVQPGKYAIIRDGRSYYLLTNPDENGLKQELRARGAIPEEWAEEVWFKLPLTEHGLFCPPDEKREDRMYCWAVDNIGRTTLTGISGVKPQTAMEYSLAFRTLPDHEIVTIVPGVGIVSWIYSHHGTVADADVKLVAFHRGARANRRDRH